ncbi:hypothetical protein L873DRAFT_1815606 [Choiromyces venosus 120613-1]|uniref:Uncharacterized protein n=1 Tax=Choiromyces venosus 120613-1 TaxID=1336337 RepID=A0A3N4JB28_9PEZI|nr:hypothetical protein L873DRAFT_1815606 [Choiromyces venosus 120613-1]
MGEFTPTSRAPRKPEITPYLQGLIEILYPVAGSNNMRLPQRASELAQYEHFATNLDKSDRLARNAWIEGFEARMKATLSDFDKIAEVLGPTPANKLLLVRNKVVFVEFARRMLVGIGLPAEDAVGGGGGGGGGGGLSDPRTFALKFAAMFSVVRCYREVREEATKCKASLVKFEELEALEKVSSRRQGSPQE